MALCRTATEAVRNHTLEYRMRAADGRYVWVRDSVTVMAEDGRAVRARGIMFDVTAQREAAAIMRRSQTELQMLNRELERRVAERTAHTVGSWVHESTATASSSARTAGAARPGLTRPPDCRHS